MTLALLVAGLIAVDPPRGPRTPRYAAAASASPSPSPSTSPPSVVAWSPTVPLGGPTTGPAALQDAGFTVTGAVRWGPAFVCRINGKPTAAVDPCVNTPRATVYWSCWHATPGGSWAYSSLGASSYNPAPGTVEGWAYGAGSPPRVAP